MSCEALSHTKRSERRTHLSSFCSVRLSICCRNPSKLGLFYESPTKRSGGSACPGGPRNVFEQGGATIARGGHHQHFRSDMMPRAMYGIHGHARNAISHVSQHRTAQNEMHARQVPRWSVVACTSSLKHYEKH